MVAGPNVATWSAAQNSRSYKRRFPDKAKTCAAVGVGFNKTMTSLPTPVIFVVDDESDDIFFLRRLIQKTERPHHFQPFSNGEAAIVALSAYTVPDSKPELPLVCFLDIKMTGMTGFDILKWIRSHKALDALPVVMISSSDHPEDIHRARELGAQGYLKKYPSIAAMQTVLDEATEFAASAPPKKTFLQWSYRFVESADSVLAK
jgi:CheY-like chemotaxis protein